MSLRLGKIFGIPIEVNYSWVLVCLLYIFLMSRQFGDISPGWQWVMAVTATALFFLSVLAHELAHSVVAVHEGIPVKGITLFIFGGVSQLAHEAHRPFTEFLVAIVGPLTSILLGLILLAAGLSLRGWNHSLDTLLSSLFLVNMVLGVFNLLPGFPLDGGRVLRSIIWALTGSYWRATQIASRTGQAIGSLLIIGGLALAVQGQWGGIWLSFIGGFLFLTATISYRQERSRESLRPYQVADVMTTEWCALPGETPLTSPLVAQGLSGGEDFVGVLVDNRVKGIVTRRQIAQAARGSWSYTTLAQVMRPLSDLGSVAPNEAIFDVVEHMDAERVDRSTVVKNGMLLGFIDRGHARRFVRAFSSSKAGL